MGPYRISRKAAGRLKTIYLYSAATFGENQAEAYFDGLHEVFERIASHPAIGRALDGKADIRRLVHRRHSIFYQSDAAGVLILDVLGAGQDPERHLVLDR